MVGFCGRSHPGDDHSGFYRVFSKHQGGIDEPG
jgi:hypothetical protein